MTSPAPSPVDIGGYLNWLINSTPITGTGGSDELNRAYMAANAQRYAAAIQAMTTAATQDQANRVRWAELMGAAPGGQMTDAAQRWRDELAAQQAVQEARLRQEFAQMMGYSVDANGNVNYNAPTLQSRQLAQEAEQAGLQRQFQGQESAFERSLRERLQSGQLSQQEAEFARTYLLQQEQSRRQQAELSGQILPSYQGGSGTIGGYGYNDANSYQMALNLAMQNGTFTPGLTEAARQAREAEAARLKELGFQGAELAGYLENGQLTEAARARRAEEATRTAQLSGRILPTYQGGSGTIGGYGYNDANSFQMALNLATQNGTFTPGLTEEARQAREQERTQRAALAAQLMQNPKDVFRAGTFFRNLGGGQDPYAMGLTGGGIAGFNSAAQRGMGTPGTATLEDVDALTGGGGTAQELQALLAPSATEQQQVATGTPQAPATGSPTTEGVNGLVWAGGAPSGMTAEQNVEARQKAGGDAALGGDSGADLTDLMDTGWWSPEDQAAAKRGGGSGDENWGSDAGFGPAGPVEDVLAPVDPLTALIASGLSSARSGRPSPQLSMGAGGDMVGREPPDGTAPGVIPYVDPAVLNDPDVQAMVTDVKAQGLEDDRNRRRGSRRRKRGPEGPAGPQGEPLRFSQKDAERRRYADERYLRGLARLNQRGVLGAPGTGPAGPVAAPLWPETGGSAAMPELQSPGSLGGDGSSFDLSAAAAPAPQSTGLTGMDPGNQQQALNYMSNFLIQGVGNQDPQFLQKMSKTQRGTAEGALQALGLNWEDFEEAVAQTRFANVGNVLSA